MMAEKLLVALSACRWLQVSRKRYRPFKEWQNIFGIRLYVRRGLFDGYEIQLEPTDSECRELAISMCPSHLISDIRKYVSLAIGAVIFVLSFWWVPDIRNWLGDFGAAHADCDASSLWSRLRAATGVLQAPITSSGDS